jgi:hypothetical protein
VPHQLRHAFTSICLQAGVEPAELTPALCHTSPESMLNYASAGGPVAPARPAYTYERLVKRHTTMGRSKKPQELHERLSAAMADKGVDAKALAELLDRLKYRTATGKSIDVRSVYQWCNGDHRPHVDALPYICIALEISADWLLGVPSNG